MFGIKTLNINGAVSRRGGQGGRVGYKINLRMLGEDIFAIVDTRPELVSLSLYSNMAGSSDGPLRLPK